ncbi:magnesium transporter [Limnobacter humi]|uniref:Magnesium transporter MgtE n=1 Tax=Limnobacter humi TaxID=1778671 RepID=A0ABT1WH64_9BURK|nr:magnesium transporter [Limnobacter humi]MCQ8896865.1 magnesium transporter [Limnobacter humi]
MDFPLDDQPESPRDLDDAQKALADVQALLRKQRVIESVVHNQQPHVNPERHKLVEELVHRQHVNELSQKLHQLHPADVAYVLESLPIEDRLVVWGLVRSERDGEILLELSDSVRETLIRSMDSEELYAATESLDADEIADLAPDLPRDVVEKLASSLSLEEREQLRAAMSYPEDSVGARMDFDMVTIRDDVTLEVVLRYLRRFDELPEQTDQVFVVDRVDHFKGSLPLDRLLVNEPETLVSEVMSREVLMLSALDDASEAAQAFERYDLVSAPVLDPSGKLIGRLTVNEVVDVIREESESDILTSAGLREEEDLFASVWESAKNRWLWLGVNLFTAFFASRVIDAFEGTIAKVVALATLMPIVAGIAGNSGNQTMTLMIRSLALGQVTAANLRLLMKKEFAIAGLNGLMWGGLAGSAAFALYFGTPNALTLGVLMMLAMMLNLLVAALIGVAVPLTLAKIGRDPAMGSSVLLTFTTDSMGFFIFLGLASLFF